MRIGYCLIILYFPTFLCSQETGISSEILRSAFNDQATRLQSEKIDFVKAHSPDLPYIEEVEFRTQTNDLDISEQEYAFRFRLNSPNQRKRQQSLYSQSMQQLEIEQQVYLDEALKDRYDLLIKSIYYINRKKILTEEKIILNDQLSILRRSSDFSNFDITDLISIEEDLHDNERALLELQNEKEQVDQLVAVWMGRSVAEPIKETQVVSVRQIEQFLSTWQLDTLQNHLYLLEQEAQVEKTQEEYLLEKAESNNLFDFFQFQYGGRNAENFRESFGLGMSIRLPFKGSSKLSLAKLKIEELEEIQRYERIEAALQREIQASVHELKSSLDQYALIEQQLQDNQASFALEQYSQVNGASPLLLLKIKAQIQKKEGLKRSFEQKILSQFIELLHRSGKLSEAPLRNYLLAGWPAI